MTDPRSAHDQRQSDENSWIWTKHSIIRQMESLFCPVCLEKEGVKRCLCLAGHRQDYVECLRCGLKVELKIYGGPK